MSVEYEAFVGRGFMFGEGNVSPMNYYNAEIAKATDKSAFTLAAFQEMDAMHKKYADGTKVKMQINLVK